jgi:hypothetical protein
MLSLLFLCSDLSSSVKIQIKISNFARKIYIKIAHSEKNNNYAFGNIFHFGLP